MVDFTVVVPTYNGADRLPRLLEKLSSQVGTEDIQWEILIIDNNSTDGTAQIVKNYQATWCYPYLLRYCFEPQQGLAFARQRGVEEAKGKLIGFLDDDNLPHLNWLIAAYTFGQLYPRAGAYNGQIHGEFEVPPPENFEKIAQFLAIREHGSQPFRFEAENLRLPPGAGLVVRKIAWQESVPPHPALIGRLKKTRIAGEDYEALLHIHKTGWEIWYNPEMHIAHQIPQERLTREYLLPLAKGIGLATYQLRIVQANNWQKLVFFLRTFLGNLRRIIRHLIKHRRYIKSDLVAAFQLHFFWGSLLSPFYFLNRRSNT